MIKHNHVCGPACGKNEQFAELCDDFELDNRAKDLLWIEVIRCRNRPEKQRVLVRMFQSTVDDTYLIRLQTATEYTVQRLGQMHFDEYEDCVSYFNWCLDVFKFDPELKQTTNAFFDDEDEGGFFDDEDEWDTEDAGFFDEDEDEGGFFDDEDEDDDEGWDID